MEKIDFYYEISEDRLRLYSRLSLLERLKWLDDVRRFTFLMRTAATTDFANSANETPMNADTRRLNHSIQ